MAPSHFDSGLLRPAAKQTGEPELVRRWPSHATIVHDCAGRYRDVHASLNGL